MPLRPEYEDVAKRLNDSSVTELPKVGGRYSKLPELEREILAKHGRTIPSYVAHEHLVMGLPLYAVAKGLGVDATVVSSIAEHFSIRVINKRGNKPDEKKVDNKAMAQKSITIVEKEPLWTPKDVDVAARKLLEPSINDPDHCDYESVVAGMREGGVNYFSQQIARDIMNWMRKERGLNKKPEEKVLEEPKKEIIPPEKKDWNYWLHQLGDAQSSFTTWSRLFVGGTANEDGYKIEHYYSVPQTPVIIETPKSVVTRDDLVTAIEQAGRCERKGAEETADNVLQFVGFDGIVLQNRFDNAGEDENGKERNKLFIDIFRKLEDIGIVYPYVIEDVNFRGWRSQYWILNERKIREYVAKDKEEKSMAEKKKKEQAAEKPKEQEVPPQDYSEIPEEAWNRSNVIPANGNGSNGNHPK